MINVGSLVLIPALPLMGSLLAFVIGKQKKSLAGLIATLAALGSFASVVFHSLKLSTGTVLHQNLFRWISLGDLNLEFAFSFDRLTAVMCLVITGIGSLIHLYSTAYMEEDESVHRFFSYLNLFLFSMLILVLGSSLPVLFVGWEGVGLCSYLLIGFWFKNSNYASAGRKAFVVNRIGDAGFLLGSFLIWHQFGTFEFSEISSAIAANPGLTSLYTLAALGLFVGATGKSAQIPLFVWLPDAMAGPTPVSALIHAATMVTAGVYLIARCNVLFSAAPEIQALVVIIAALTAFVAAFTALTQNDIKKVLAYSTVSQLGFMFLAAGSGAYWVALFHVVTHAFFKACLFLCAGSVIHGCHHEQDMREMGGLWKKMPITFATYLLATLAIAGICPLSGYYSKHAILASLEHFDSELLESSIVWILRLATLTAFMTAFYMTRSLVMTFFGSYRGHAHPHESPFRMTIPLIVLAALSVVGGFLPLGEYVSGVLPFHSHHAESIIDGLVHSWVGFLGIGLGIVFYLFVPTIPELIAKLSGPLAALSRGKFFLDEIYSAFIVKPLQGAASFLFQVVDQGIIDGAVNGAGAVTEASGEVLRGVQTGQIRHYALAIASATVLFVGLYLLM